MPRVFYHNPTLLFRALVDVRINRRTYMETARKFGCDHTTLIHWDKKTDMAIVNSYFREEQKAFISEGLYVIRKEMHYLNIPLDKKVRAIQNIDKGKVMRRKQREVLALKKKKSLNVVPPVDPTYEKINRGHCYAYILAKSQERELRRRVEGECNNL